MKKLVGTVLLAFLCVGLAFAQAQTPPAGTMAKAPSVSDGIKQLEHDWTDAMKAGDIDKLSTIIADDWTGIGPDGATETKKIFLDSIKSGDEKIQSVEFGPMDVKVIGSVAICQGSDVEKSSMKGKDTSGKWVWMDVFANRGGKWVAVRSQTAMVK
jgi:ketosteroid isomerase-like protein